MPFRYSASSGMPLANPAAVTPGMAASRSRISDCMRMTRSGSGASASGMAMRTVCIRSGCVNPGDTARMARKLRIISPEATSSTNASATCVTTSAFWARSCPAP